MSLPGIARSPNWLFLPQFTRGKGADGSILLCRESPEHPQHLFPTMPIENVPPPARRRDPPQPPRYSPNHMRAPETRRIYEDGWLTTPSEVAAWGARPCGVPPIPCHRVATSPVLPAGNSTLGVEICPIALKEKPKSNMQPPLGSWQQTGGPGSPLFNGLFPFYFSLWKQQRDSNAGSAVGL